MLIQVFALRFYNQLLTTNDLAIALKKVIWEEYTEFTKDLRQKFRVSCFTTSPFSQLMWSAKYANEHKGFCIEYTLSTDKEYTEALQNLRPVIYTKVRHPITQALLESHNQNHTTKSLRDLYLNGALRKSLDWAYQNEWRLLWPPDRYDQKGFSMKFFPISKVYLGNRMPPQRRKKIINICKKKGIPYAGVIRSSNKYEMKECSELCENCHLVCMR